MDPLVCPFGGARRSGSFRIVAGAGTGFPFWRVSLWFGRAVLPSFPFILAF